MQPTVSDLGSIPEAPVPADRPVRLLGGPGGRSLFGEIALQVALSFVGPLISAAATAIIGWLTYQWARWFKADFDKKSADSLHQALERGMLAAIEALGVNAPRSGLLAHAADHAEQWNGGNVKRFKLSTADLQQLALPHVATAEAKAN